MAIDRAMLVYLSNAENRKGAPNQNFARELMELFTLGGGHSRADRVDDGEDGRDYPPELSASCHKGLTVRFDDPTSRS